MAIYLMYRRVAQGATWVEYEIHTAPDDPDPARVRLNVDESAPLPVVEGPKVAANRAVRTIRNRWITEGIWPKGGIIQS